jgi:hypothetical protein
MHHNLKINIKIAIQTVLGDIQTQYKMAKSDFGSRHALLTQSQLHSQKVKQTENRENSQELVMFTLAERKINRVVLGIVLAALFLLVATQPRAGLAQVPDNNLTTLYVSANTGQDTASCGTQTQPCASIQYAVNKAASGQTIRVAAGVYTFNEANDSCSAALGTTAVVCIRNKDLTLLGGFTPNNWTNANPATNISVIDGQNSNRGILVQSGISLPPSQVVMEGFTVRNGRVQGANSGTDAQTFAFGGGMRADFSTITLRDMIFRNNKALGGNTNSVYGGAASGGAIAIRAGANTSILERVIFEANEAIGGNGLGRGGFGIGGGLYTFDSDVTASYVTFTNNLARGGNSDGNGLCFTNNNADGQGGGAAFHRDSIARLQYVTVVGNRAVGGNAPNGQAGGSFGGGLYAESSHLMEVRDATIYDNVSLGGNGLNASSGGSVSFGGGLATTNTSAVLDRVRIINNKSQGGDGAIIKGSGNGGGTSFVRTQGSETTQIINSVFTDNQAFMGNGSTVSGGGGGGIYMRGSTANMAHITVARNALNSANMQGSGILLISSSSLPASATISNSIVAQHTATGNFAIQTQPNNPVTLQAVLFSGNESNYGGGGAFIGLGTIISGPVNFTSPGAPNYDYSLLGNSAARDASLNSTIPVDINRETRDATPDMGAYEYRRPEITAVYGVPTASNSALIYWQVANMQEELGYFELTINCPPGGNAPYQMACGVPLNVGAQTSYSLSGLTNYMEYSVKVSAYSATGQVLSQKTITIMPVDIFLYLPLVTR